MVTLFELYFLPPNQNHHKNCIKIAKSIASLGLTHPMIALSPNAGRSLWKLSASWHACYEQAINPLKNRLVMWMPETITDNEDDLASRACPDIS